MAELIFSFNAVMPVFLIVFLGIVLKRTGMIDSHFVRMSSRLVFNITIPALIFINLAKSDLAATFQGGMIIIGVSVVVISFLLLWIFTGRISDIRSRGSFIQVSFRSNFAILGLALLHNLYGDPAIAPASVLLTFIMPPFNILSHSLNSLRCSRVKDMIIDHWREYYEDYRKHSGLIQSSALARYFEPLSKRIVYIISIIRITLYYILSFDIPT